MTARLLVVCLTLVPLTALATPDLAAVEAAEARLTTSLASKNVDETAKALSGLCTWQVKRCSAKELRPDGRRGQCAPPSPGPYSARAAAVTRRVAVVMEAAGRYQNAYDARTCTLEVAPTDADRRAEMAAVERLATRWLKDDAADALALRHALGRDAWLVQAHTANRREVQSRIACARSYLSSGELTPCDPQLAGLLGAKEKSFAPPTGDVNRAITSASRVDLGLVPDAAAANALDAIAVSYERRWGDDAVAVMARWMRGLAHDPAAIPDSDRDRNGYRRWFAQLLLVRARLLRDRGDVAGALRDTTTALHATRDPRALLEHAESLRSTGHFHEAEVRLTELKSRRTCQPRELDDGALARLAALLAIRGKLAGFAADVAHCRPTATVDAAKLLAEPCPACSADDRTALRQLATTITAATGALSTGRDEAACDLVDAALGAVFPGDDLAAAAKTDLGVTYYGEGRYAQALQVLDEADCFATGSAFEVTVLANKSAVLFSAGRLDEADVALKKALRIANATGATERVRVALEANAGKLALARGDLDAAHASATRALAALVSTDVLLRAQVLDDIAIADDLAGRHDVAEREFREALALRETAAPDHPSIATSLGHLATLAWSRRRPLDALPLFRRMLAIEEDTLGRMLAWGTETNQRDALARLADRVDWLVTLDNDVLHANTDATRMAFASVVGRQGRALDAAARSRRTRFARGASKLFDELRATNERLVWVALNGGPAPELADLRAKAQKLDALVATQIGEVEHGAELGPDGVAGRLIRGQALVDFVVYRPFHPERVTDRFGEPHYAVYVVKPDGRIAHADLGPATEIDKAIAAWRTQLASPTDDRAAASALARLVFVPVAPLVGDARDLLVVGDGSVTLVPFDALVYGGKRLVDSYRITMLTSARELAAPAASSSGDTVVFANPNFGIARDTKLVTGLLDGVQFPPLPGTAREADAIVHELDGAKLLVGPDASGSAFKDLHAPRIVHVATHGFFLGGEVSAASGTRGLVRVTPSQTRPPTADVSASWRSGLAFADANSHRPGTILTGLELADVDLRGTRLVTLSACETGVGEATPGDGVYGVRRALVLAGSESQVLSLWKVDDEATADLMTRFYRALRLGKSRGQALREAKLAIAAIPRYARPYFWAGFILSGSENKLDGSPPEPIVVEPVSAPVAPRIVARRPGCGCDSSDGSPFLALLAIIRIRFRSGASSSRSRPRVAR